MPAKGLKPNFVLSATELPATRLDPVPKLIYIFYSNEEAPWHLVLSLTIAVILYMGLKKTQKFQSKGIWAVPGASVRCYSGEQPLPARELYQSFKLQSLAVGNPPPYQDLTFL